MAVALRVVVAHRELVRVVPAPGPRYGLQHRRSLAVEPKVCGHSREVKCSLGIRPKCPAPQRAVKPCLVPGSGAFFSFSVFAWEGYFTRRVTR